MVDRWREHQYRKLYHLSHDQYLDEPVHVVDWALAMEHMESDMTREQVDRDARRQ